MKPFNDVPFETHRSDERGYEIFRDLVWNSSEVCNSCFTQIRTIGPEKHTMLETPTEKCLEDGSPLVLTQYEWYERTEHGSQEHTTWDANRRFGTCFCENCGTDCTGNHRNTSLEALKPLARNIYRYVTYETKYELDPNRFGAAIRRLKSLRSAQGNETEVLAIAFARALDCDRAATIADNAKTAVDSNE